MLGLTQEIEPTLPPRKLRNHKTVSVDPETGEPIIKRNNKDNDKKKKRKVKVSAEVKR